MTSLQLPGADVAGAARAHLLGAHARVTDAVTTAHRSLAVAWSSPAADAFRADVGDLVAAVDGDLRVIEAAAASVPEGVR
ncbi:hypothetical protein LEP48_00915 [Isoptericola sp. NEAU-Y5]|uniref:WXG100 family type VII secretion target n=1 Tax=Isoptericola luteus TaxID=2879484 RepID=A0ABS7ZA25_9MICO|nr:hypothetical protein [Isoptericola sp. NEAU-Y5]MCA5891911.1 hypothetical protein [Isoptericola sp. NEAU-Y5]